ncbi:autotransporter domain-containing protein [Phyllobacterium zundukense]|jgi:outer membrane autotransporter protein|uniref:Autotransporter domain-containing protein n=1 Tax=Phyllobacterium zundukense TaxID=1867719 RepID=A0ACD4D5J8_9HYPH|nr:autotransporter domain-containing protein [Phyllobacterium zundukense]UXN61066.1 autotransporter domain-containing protein [Phyllobacterium zundukense]
MIVVRMGDKTTRALRTGLITVSFSIFILIPAEPGVAQQIVTSGQVTSGILTTPGPQPSPWDVGYLLNVGSDLVNRIDGEGSLIIRDGGVAFHSRVDPDVDRLTTDVGRNTASVGTVLVTGAGSSFDYGHQMLIGGAGSGTLVIENGARVFDAGADFNGAPPATAIGSEAGGSGMVRVDGTGSLWGAGSRLSVGTRGAGSLDIIGGGRVSTDMVVAIARFPEANGTVTIRGVNSVLDPGRFLFVGLGGTGSVSVLDGAAVRSLDRVDIGGGAGVPAQGIVAGSGTGIVNVAGAGAALSAASELTIGNTGTGTLNLGIGGTAASPVISIASEPGSSGTLNVLGGALQTDSIAFGAGSGAFNLDPATDYDLTARMSGSGAFNVLSGNVIQTGDSSGFTGNTNLVGGNLIVNGTLGGIISVEETGLLGGTGTVGSTSINDGGLLAPGNSIGTLHVDGNLTFNQGSTYQVEVDPAGNGDKTLVSGIATLSGGHVDVIASSGSWRIGTVYTILTAAGGLNGSEFLGVSSNLQFLTPALSYDADNVLLTLTLVRLPPDPGPDPGPEPTPVVFGSLAKTPNQKNAIQSLDRFLMDNRDTDNPLIGMLLGLDKATAPLTIAQLPGEIHASLASVLLDDGRFIRDAANNRLRSAFGDVAAPPIPVLAYGPDGVEPQIGTGDRFAVWGQGFGSWADWESNDQVPGVDRSVGGFLIGGDAAVGDNARIGVLSGYSQTSIDESGLDASADVDDIHLGIYGGAEFGRLRLRSGASYTWHDISTDRTVQFTGSEERLTADYNGGTAQIFGEFGYSLQYNTVTIEPFANLAYANLHLDSFAEEGGSAALAGASSDADVTFTTLGLRASKQLLFGDATAMLRGMAGWRHAYGDVTPLSSLAFAGMDSFEISALPIARDAALVEVGLDIDLAPATTFGFSYRGQIASEVQDHGVRADLTVRF